MTGSANANLRSDCIIRRHVFKQLVSKLNTKYISISLRYRDIINTYFLELSWFIFKGLAYMQLCKPKWRCLVLFRRRLSPGNTFKQHILVQSLSNCVLKNFKIPTAACRVGDLALGFFLQFLWALHNPNLREICWDAHSCEIVPKCPKVAKPANQLIMCIWLAAPGWYLHSWFPMKQ